MHSSAIDIDIHTASTATLPEVDLAGLGCGKNIRALGNDSQSSPHDKTSRTVVKTVNLFFMHRTPSKDLFFIICATLVNARGVLSLNLHQHQNAQLPRWLK